MTGEYPEYRARGGAMLYDDAPLDLDPALVTGRWPPVLYTFL
jgi:hypothetical protein